ncbi:MAG: HAD hydrolase-like protein [Nitrospirae bacterium]|nr:HAD hydrolase-like protein [Nitrospirota bacterium]
MRLVLFDVDGTLIDSGGAGVRSLALAFTDLFSIEDAFHGINMAGKTDLQIIKEGLAKHGISADGNVKTITDTYLKHLGREIDNSRIHIKPGISDVLRELSFMKDIKLGLLTGNFEQGARIKLEPFNINRYFPTGAFGSDDEDRDNLLPIAIRRFEELYKIKIKFYNCTVIGDTPRDIYCSKPYGAVSIGVATGPYSVDALRQAGADCVFDNLSDYSSLLQMFV